MNPNTGVGEDAGEDGGPVGAVAAELGLGEFDVGTHSRKTLDLGLGPGQRLPTSLTTYPACRPTLLRALAQSRVGSATVVGARRGKSASALYSSVRRAICRRSQPPTRPRVKRAQFHVPGFTAGRRRLRDKTTHAADIA